MSEPVVQKARTTEAGDRVVEVYRSSDAPTVNDDADKGVIAGTIWEIINDDGKVTGVYICSDPTDGAAVWKKAIIVSQTAEYMVLKLDDVLVFTEDAYATLGTVPAGAVIEHGELNHDTAIVLDTAVKLGLGTAADPDSIGKTGTTMTKNTKTKFLPTREILAADTPIRVSAVDSSGDAAGSVTSGSVHARVIFTVFEALADA